MAITPVPAAARSLTFMVGPAPQRKPVTVKVTIGKDGIRLQAGAADRTQAFDRTLKFLPIDQSLAARRFELDLTDALLHRILMLGMHRIRMTETALAAIKHSPHCEALILDAGLRVSANLRGLSEKQFEYLKAYFGAEQLLLIGNVILTEADLAAPFREELTGN